MTRRERQVLDTIARGIDAGGQPPTVRELQDALGVVSTSQVAATLDRLEERGLIHRARGLKRNIALTDAGRAALGRAEVTAAARAIVQHARPGPDGGYVVPAEAFDQLTLAIGEVNHG